MTVKKTPQQCQPAKLEIRAVAARLGIGSRQLIRLANRGIPGLERAPNGRNFLWREHPKTMKWIRREERLRKGKKKHHTKRKNRYSKAQLFSRAIGRVEKQVRSHLERALEKPTHSELEKLSNAARRLRRISDDANLRILAAGVFVGR